MATRPRTFSSTSVGRARQELRIAQRAVERKATAAAKRRVTRAESNLLFEINLRKRRKPGKKT